MIYQFSFIQFLIGAHFSKTSITYMMVWIRHEESLQLVRHRIQVSVTMYIIVMREFHVDLLKIAEEIRWQNLEDFR